MSGGPCLVLAARGSRGDVYPVLELAGELRRRGCRVRLCLPEAMAAAARERGCRELFCFNEDPHQLMRLLRQGWASWNSVIDWVGGVLEQQARLLQQACRGADLLLATATELAAPSVAERCRLPYLRLAYAPILPGDQPPPLLPWQGTPRLLNRLLWKLINGSAAWVARRPLQQLRRSLGLGPLDNLAEHLAGAGTTVLAVSPWLAPPSPAWRHPFAYTGAIAADGGAAGLPAELEDFLRRGAAPIYVGFGSVQVRRRREVVAAVLEGARRAGCRLLLGRGWSDLDVAVLPEDVMVVGEVPHGLLFPRLAAVVHHGGSGTVHSAARAGVPQLLVPHIVDQFYWARRVVALGLGPAAIAPRRLNPGTLARSFTRLTGDTAMRARCQSLARALRREDGLTRAAGLVIAAAGNRRRRAA